MNAFVNRLLDLLYPPRCAFCRRLLNDAERGVCRFCRRRYAGSGTRRELRDGLLCVAPLRYEDQVRESLLRYKFRGVTAYGAAYAEFLAKCIDESDISCDIITWVPLSRRRLRKRGYDQARILAEETAKRLGIPCESLLKKKIDTRPQSGIMTPRRGGRTRRASMSAARPRRRRTGGCWSLTILSPPARHSPSARRSSERPGAPKFMRRQRPRGIKEWKHESV